MSFRLITSYRVSVVKELEISHETVWDIITNNTEPDGRVGKINCIKNLREWFRFTYAENLGLKDAKDIVENTINLMKPSQ